MNAVIYTLPLIILSVAIGVVVPWLGIRFELSYRAERKLARQLAEQSRLTAEREITIDAYRQLVADDPNFALTPNASTLLPSQTGTAATRRS